MTGGDIMKLSERFKTILNESGLTQRDFASTLGITENYISLLINGKKEKISETLAFLIQEKYGYSAEWILTGKGDKFINTKNSFIKQKTIAAVKSLSDEEIKAVMAFINSMEDLRKIFESIFEETTATHEYDTEKCFMSKVAEERSKYKTSYTIPLLGRVAGGMPILAVQGHGKQIRTHIKSDCALEVVGDSMEPNYKSGDIILVHRQPELLNGELGVIMILEGAEIAEVTFKRFYQDEDRIILKSINPKYPDQILKKVDVMIYGKVVGKHEQKG